MASCAHSGWNQYGETGETNINMQVGDEPGEMGDNLPALDFGTGREALFFFTRQELSQSPVNPVQTPEMGKMSKNWQLLACVLFGEIAYKSQKKGPEMAQAIISGHLSNSSTIFGQFPPKLFSSRDAVCTLEEKSCPRVSKGAIRVVQRGGVDES